MAREEKVVVVTSLFERRAAGLYHNTVAMLESDGSLGGIYRKMLIPDDPLYYEKFYFTSGDLGFKAFDTSVGQVGALICSDRGTRKQPASPPCAEPICCFIPPPSAGIRQKKKYWRSAV